MKNLFGFMICSVFFCGSCTTTRQEIRHEKENNPFGIKTIEKFPLWDGESPLWLMRRPGIYDMQEPVCVLVYERAPATKDWWYPTKVFSDTPIVKEIVMSLMFPRSPNSFTFYTDSYILVLSVGRSLGSVNTALVPYMMYKEGYVIIPSGKDERLYEILTSAPEKENFFGSDVIDNAQILPRMSGQNAQSADPNNPSMPMKTDF